MAKGGNNEIGALSMAVDIDTAGVPAQLKVMETAVAASADKMAASMDFAAEKSAGLARQLADERVRDEAAAAARISALRESITNRFAAQDAAAAAAAGGGIGGLGARLKESTAGVRGFMGAVVGALGIATRFIGVIGLITGAVVGVTSALIAGGRAIVNFGISAEDAGKKLANPLIKELEKLKELDPIKFPVNFTELDAAAVRLPELVKEIEAAKDRVDHAVTSYGEAFAVTALNKLVKEQKKLQDETNAAIERGKVIAADATKQRIADDARYAEAKSKQDRKKILDAQELAEAEAETQRNVDRATALRNIAANRRENEQTYQNQRREAKRERIEERRELAAEIGKAVRDAVRDATKETLSEMRDLLKAQVASTRQVEQQTRAVKNGMYRGGDR